LENLPESSGVYIFKDRTGRILYVGKANNLRNRVKAYFKGKDGRVQVPKLVSKIAKVETRTTESEIEALLLEADFIKHFKPPFNIRFRDDKSYSYIYINFADKIPTVRLVRKKQIDEGAIKIRKKDKIFGPFTNLSQIKIALRELRKIFPWCAEVGLKLQISNSKTQKRGCRYFQIGLCPGICAGKISESSYRKIVRQLSLVLAGGKKEILRQMRKEMKKYAAAKKYELAADLRDKIKALEHISKVSLIRKKDERNLANIVKRIEGYDVANISGKLAVGVMVVYGNQKLRTKDQNDDVELKATKLSQVKPRDSSEVVGFDKNEYRMFRVRTVKGINDVAMIGEVIKRRFKHREWERPSLIIVDGGAGQAKIVKLQIQNYKLQIPIIAIAKGRERRGEKLYFAESQFEFRYLPEWARRNIRLIKKIRDEAHRFAQRYFHILQTKSQKKSEIEQIPGIGTKTYKKLINHFGSLKKIKKAGLNELAKVIGGKKAEKIKKWLNK